MVSALYSGSSGPGSSLSRHTTLCSWTRQFTLIVTLSIKLDIGELMLGVTLLWTNIPNDPIHGKVEIMLQKLE